jgi:hypothetical protein
MKAMTIAILNKKMNIPVKQDEYGTVQVIKEKCRS